METFQKIILTSACVPCRRIVTSNPHPPHPRGWSWRGPGFCCLLRHHRRCSKYPHSPTLTPALQAPSKLSPLPPEGSQHSASSSGPPSSTLIYTLNLTAHCSPAHTASEAACLHLALPGLCSLAQAVPSRESCSPPTFSLLTACTHLPVQVKSHLS